jgi:Zn-finger nucleic acid-binding protein
MNCPVCTTVTLQMAERQGVEIDHCPKCRGVWLDRGELDKLIDRSAEVHSAQASRRGFDDRDDDDDYRDRDDYRRRASGDDYHDRDYRGPRKRRGFLGELFDFD